MNGAMVRGERLEGMKDCCSDNEAGRLLTLTSSTSAGVLSLDDSDSDGARRDLAAIKTVDLHKL